MCVAEALLRIPDNATADKLIRDKLRRCRLEASIWAHSESLFVNASTWGLMLTGKLVTLAEGNPPRLHRRTAVAWSAARASRSIRLAVRQAMRIMGHQFVMGRTIERSARSLRRRRKRGLPLFLRHARRSGADAAETAERYQQAYRNAIAAHRRTRRRIAEPTARRAVASR